MSTSITMNLTRKVDASRTHERDIDVKFWEGGGLEGSHIRVFLSDTLAMELAQKIIRAIATPLRPAVPAPDPEKVSILWKNLEVSSE